MSISVECPACGHAFKAKDKYAGRLGACPQCKAAVQVPARTPQVRTSPSPRSTTPVETPRPAGETKSYVTVRCTDCRRHFKAREKSAPRKKRCPSCGASITVPTKSPSPNRPRPAATAPADDSWDDLVADVAPVAETTNAYTNVSVGAPLPTMRTADRPAVTFHHPQINGRALVWAILAIAAAVFVIYGLINGEAALFIAVGSLLTMVVCYIIVVVRIVRLDPGGMGRLLLVCWLIVILVNIFIGGLAAAVESEPSSGICLWRSACSSSSQRSRPSS